MFFSKRTVVTLLISRNRLLIFTEFTRDVFETGQGIDHAHTKAIGDGALQLGGDERFDQHRTAAVGLGDPNGVPIPVRPGSTANRRDSDGQVVVSKLNEKLLIEVAGAGEGAYIPGARINSLVDELDKLQKTEMSSRVFSEFAERFQYFAGFALILLLIEALIRSRKNPLLKRFNLFNTNQ